VSLNDKEAILTTKLFRQTEEYGLNAENLLRYGSDFAN